MQVEPRPPENGRQTENLYTHLWYFL